MLTNIKTYIEDFRVLPDPIKYAVYFVVAGLVLFCFYQSASNSISNKKIEDLEKKNAELNITAAQSETKAKLAEENAANEAANRKQTEEKLKSLEKEIRTSDEKIISQSKKSNDIRRDLDRVRGSKPVRADESEIRRKAKKRYGPAIDDR